MPSSYVVNSKYEIWLLVECPLNVSDKAMISYPHPCIKCQAIHSLAHYL